MNTRILRSLSCIIAALFSTVTLTTAQVQSANNSPSGLVHGCKQCNSTDDVASINCDMFDIEPYPGGSNYNDVFYAIVFDGAQGYNTSTFATVTDQAWLYVDNTISPNAAWKEIPAPGTGLNNTTNGKVPAHDMDVAIGNYYDAMGMQKYFAIVVYEAGGDIYFESYDLGYSGGTSITGPHQPVAYLLQPPYITGGQYRLSSGGGECLSSPCRCNSRL